MVVYTGVCASLWYYNTVQAYIDTFYQWILTTWFFNSVYFETLWTGIVYVAVLHVAKAYDKLKFMDKFKINPESKWHERNNLLEDAWEAICYMTPFFILDTFMVKRYWDVDPEEWIWRRKSWIQSTRALPTFAPTFSGIIIQLIGSFIIYDAIFFLIHFASHKNLFLYKNLHAAHHNHEILTSRVSNQMTMIERIMLVLAANQSLKIMCSHPFTRAIFVIILLYWLMENHLGYDLPWGLDKLTFGFIGGSYRHYQHHMCGERHYQPFFTYIDDWILPFIDRKLKWHKE